MCHPLLQHKMQIDVPIAVLFQFFILIWWMRKGSEHFFSLVHGGHLEVDMSIDVMSRGEGIYVCLEMNSILSTRRSILACNITDYFLRGAMEMRPLL